MKTKPEIKLIQTLILPYEIQLPVIGQLNSVWPHVSYTQQYNFLPLHVTHSTHTCTRNFSVRICSVHKDFDLFIRLLVLWVSTLYCQHCALGIIDGVFKGNVNLVGCSTISMESSGVIYLDLYQYFPQNRPDALLRLNTRYHVQMLNISRITQTLRITKKYLYVKSVEFPGVEERSCTHSDTLSLHQLARP